MEPQFHFCGKFQASPTLSRLRGGPKRVQTANEDIHRHRVQLVVIHGVQKRCRHFMQHKSADERAQYPKRVHRLLALYAGAFEDPERDAAQQLILSPPFR